MSGADLNLKKMSDLINESNETENNKFKDIFTENKEDSDEVKYNKTTLKPYEDILTKMGGEGNEGYNRKLKPFEKLKPIIKNSLFSETEIEALEELFILNSSNGIMSIQGFWKVLGLESIADTSFGKIFYRAACTFSDNKNPNQVKFMTEHKFLQILALLTKKNKINSNIDNLFEGGGNSNPEEAKELYMKARYLFLFTLFDVDDSGEISKLDFRNVISSFLELVVNGKYGTKIVDETIGEIIANKEKKNLAQFLEDVVDTYVDNTFSDYSYNGEIMTYDGWKKWIDGKIVGIQKMMDFCFEINDDEDKKSSIIDEEEDEEEDDIVEEVGEEEENENEDN